MQGRHPQPVMPRGSTAQESPRRGRAAKRSSCCLAAWSRLPSRSKPLLGSLTRREVWVEDRGMWLGEIERWDCPMGRVLS